MLESREPACQRRFVSIVTTLPYPLNSKVWLTSGHTLLALTNNYHFGRDSEAQRHCYGQELLTMYTGES